MPSVVIVLGAYSTNNASPPPVHTHSLTEDLSVALMFSSLRVLKSRGLWLPLLEEEMGGMLSRLEGGRGNPHYITGLHVYPVTQYRLHNTMEPL